MYLKKHYDGDMEYISANDIFKTMNEEDQKTQEIYGFLVLIEREIEKRQAERAFREDLNRNYEYGGYGMWYPKSGFGCGRYQDPDGTWHSEM